MTNSKRVRPSRLLPMVALPVFLAIANQTMIAVALPAIGGDLGELSRLPWLVVGYMIALTVAGPVYGALGDAWGRKSLMSVALLVYVAGTVLCVLAPSFEALAVGRVIQGLGGGGLMSLSQAILGQMLDGRDRGRMQGYVATVGVMASAVAPALGGLVVGTIGWRNLFAATIPVALVAQILLFSVTIPHRKAVDRRFDVNGLLLLVFFTVTGTIGLEIIGRPGHLPLAGALLLAGAIAVIVLLKVEAVAANPLFPLAAMRHPAIWRADAMAALHGASLVSMAAFLPLYLHLARGMDTIESALSVTVMAAGVGVGGFATGQLIGATGRTLLYPSMGLALASASIALVGVTGASLWHGALLALLALAGLGMGTVMSVVHTAVQEATAPALRGAMAGAVTFSRSIGSVLGTTIVSLVIFTLAGATGASDAATAWLADPASLPDDVRRAWQTAFTAGFLVIAALVAAGWAMAVSSPGRRIT